MFNCIFLSLVCQIYCMKTLKMVHVVYRHGARSPLVNFPTNSHKNDWPVDPGMLTKVGMNMEYELGRFLKKRYMIDNHFLNKTYIQKEIYIRSSDTPRCLQSAETQLAGLYPPTGYQVWHNLVNNWQPIPIHTVPNDQDSLLRSLRTPCPRLRELLTAQKKKVDYIKKEKENKMLLSLLSNYTGMTVNFKELWVVYDVLKCDIAQGFAFDSWLTPSLYDQIIKLGDWTFLNKFQGDEEFSRLVGGVLLYEIVSHMEKFAINRHYKDLYKMNIYSGHDTTILSLMAALNVDLSVPPFAASIMIELYQDVNNSLFVEIEYRNSTGNPFFLKLHDCDISCPLDHFLRLTQNRSSPVQLCLFPYTDRHTTISSEEGKDETNLY
ncbi:lysosomal acid phosphatase isoform X4 [Hydra vulgaris]|uniref:acid phosphatase n=2 Tax=Hydra vulgaris TaxID=6087 RepID=A0ABM4D876_HYDVU